MFATFAHGLQRYVLPLAFGYMAWTRLTPLLERRAWAPVVAALAGHSTVANMVYLQRFAQSLMLIAFNVLVAILLVSAKRPARPPERVSHVVVPLVATFSYFGYGFAGRLPYGSNDVWLLPAPGLPRIVIGGLLVLAAYVLSFTALLYLRRSFAVFVQVDRAVLNGPYRYVRHPMYLGYVLVVVALFLTRPTLAYALLSVLVLAVTVLRARLEEQMLALHAPGYAEHARRTGMLFPRRR